MLKFFNTLANERGDVLPNYRLQVVDGVGATVTIYRDKAGTRFTDASGNVVNYATAGANGRVSFYWEPAVGQTLQTLDVAGDLVDAEADFADSYVLDVLPGEIAQAAVTNLPADLASKAAEADLGERIEFYANPDTALTTATYARGNGKQYTLTGNATATNLNALENARLTAASPVTVTLGGSVDGTVSLTMAQTAVAAGARQIAYTALTGTISAGDWIALSGHNPQAWTDASGRNVEWKAMLQVREHDTVGKILKFYQSIPFGLDAQTVGGTLYSITAQKVNPKKVDLSRLALQNVQVVLQYVIDSDIEVTHLAADSTGTGLTVSWATNCRISAASRNRNTDGGAHNVTLEWLYGCKTDVMLVGTNPAVASAAKGVRGRSWTACDTRILANDVGVNVLVLEGMTGGSLDVIATGAGTYFIDNNITTVNRNDSIHVQFARNARITVQANEADCTGVEFFNCIGCDAKASVTRYRTGPSAGDSGIINVKGICHSSRFDLFARVFNNVASTPAVRFEFADNDSLSGGFQRSLTVNLDVETDSDVGAFFRDNATTGMNVNLRVSGYVKAAKPIIVASEIGGIDIHDLKAEVDTAAAGASHAITLNSSGNTVRGCRMIGTSGTTRRAVSCAFMDSRIFDCTSDGGAFYINETLTAAFDLRNFGGLNNVLYCANGGAVYQFFPCIDGGWEFSGLSETFDGTIGEFKLPLTVGTWTVGDVLRKRNGARGEKGWKWDGTYWRRRGSKIYNGSGGFNTGLLAAGATYTFDFTVTGAQLRDRIQWGSSVSLENLTCSVHMVSANTARFVAYNGTGAALGTAIAGTVYATAEAWNYA